MLSAERDNFTPFQFWCLLFVFLGWVLRLELPVLGCIGWWEWAALSCFCSWRKDFHPFLTEYVSSVFVIYGLYYVYVHSLYNQFVESFYLRGWWALSNAFLYLLRWSYNFLPFILLMCILHSLICMYINHHTVHLKFTYVNLHKCQ